MEAIANQGAKGSWFSDKRNITKLVIFGPAILIGLYYSLPFLNTILEGLIDGTLNGLKLIWTLAALIGSLLVLTSKKTWRLLDYAFTIIGKMLTFWIIDWDEFVIQEKEIEQAEKDTEKLDSEGRRLRGEESNLTEQIKEKTAEMKESLEMSKLATNENMATLKMNDYTRAKEFIQEITPLRDDITFLANYCEKAYDDSQYKIKDAWATLNTEKAKFRAVTAGESALKSAQKALLGDLALSADAKLARERMKQKISAKISNIKGAIRITSRVMEEKDLKDRAKLQVAKQEIQQMITSGQSDIAMPVIQVQPGQFKELAERHKGLL